MTKSWCPVNPPIAVMMNYLKSIPRIVALAPLILMPVFAHAQMNHAMQPGMTMVADTSMTEGEIRKIDKSLGKVTIKHGPIRNLDMPAMTMVFNVKDTRFLDKVKVGDKVRFVVVMDAGKMVITDLQPVE